MAKKQLTIEEKLQAALVPAEEQPYKVPENWCWVKFSVTYDNVSSSKNKIKQKDYQNEGKFAIVDQGENLIGGYSNNEDIVYDGELPVIIFGDHTRRIKYVDFPFIQGADGVKVLQPKNYIVPRYYYFCLQSMQIPHMGYRRHFPILNKMGFPIAPIAEQSRIVARIESLFAKLDEAKEKIQEVLDGADLRRAAILHQAFTGDLTEKWRKSHTVTCAKDLQTKALVAREGQPESWIRCKIGDYLELKAGKFISAAEINAEISDVTPYECFGGNGIRGYVKNYNTEGTHPLIGRQGALCGNVQVGEGKFYATEHAVVVTYKYDTDTMWIVELLRHMNLNQYSRSVAQPGLAVKNIVELPIVIAPYEEQVEIGRILDNLLSREQSTVNACEEALTTIDTLKKSILARAFRGELGTNDPADPSAKELLREILSA